MRILAYSILGTALWISSSLALAQTSTSPQETINTAILRMLSELRANADTLSTDPNAAMELINRETDKAFDFDLVAQLAMGKYWRDATPEQRATFTREFRIMLARFYGKALTRGLAEHGVPADDSFTVLPGNDDPKAKYATVRVRVRRNDGSLLQLEYGMRRNDETWKVYDVKVEGISVVMSYRNNLAQRINSAGIDGLLAELIEKNQQQTESDLVNNEALSTRKQ